jgi:hypothetical protein
MKYKICVKSTTGRILTYTTSEYEILDNTLIKFYDEKFGVFKIFDCRNVEMEVLEE